MVVYTILNNEIVGIRNEGINYVLQPNERGSDTWYQIPFYNVNTDEVEESITQQQIDERAELEIERLIEEDLRTKESDGLDAVKKLKRFIQRKKNDEDITLNQFKGIKNSLRDLVGHLKEGDWLTAQDEILSITPPINADLLAIYNLIKDKIDTYVTNNY